MSIGKVLATMFGWAVLTMVLRAVFKGLGVGDATASALLIVVIVYVAVFFYKRVKKISFSKNIEDVCASLLSKLPNTDTVSFSTQDIKFDGNVMTSYQNYGISYMEREQVLHMIFRVLKKTQENFYVSSEMKYFTDPTTGEIDSYWVGYLLSRTSGHEHNELKNRWNSYNSGLVVSIAILGIVMVGLFVATLMMIF